MPSSLSFEHVVPSDVVMFRDHKESTRRLTVKVDLVTFIMLFTARIWVPLVGQLYLCEIVAGFYLLRHSPRILSTPSAVRKLLFAGFFWLIGQVIIDVYLGTSGFYALKGFANILCTVVLTVALCDSFSLVSPERRKWIPIWAGCGIVIGSVLQPVQHFQSNPFKWGLGLGIGLILLGTICAYPKSRKHLPILVLVFSLGLIFLANSRSLGGFFLLAFILSFSTRKLFKFKSLSLAFFVTLTTFILFLGSQLVVQISPDSEVGKKLAADSASQIGFLNSRTEVFFELQAVRDSPLIGYGSDPSKPPQELIASVLQNLNSLGVRPFYRTLYGDMLPVHSQILGAWIRGGAFVLVFWFVLLRMFYRAIFLIPNSDTGFRLLGWFCLLYQLWATFFSPLASVSRFDVAFTTGIIYLHLNGLLRGDTAKNRVREGQPQI
jgi:hypothetical protein